MSTEVSIQRHVEDDKVTVGSLVFGEYFLAYDNICVKVYYTSIDQGVYYDMENEKIVEFGDNLLVTPIKSINISYEI